MATIKFNPVSKLVQDTIPMPIPARKVMPEWYKKAPSFTTKPTEVESVNEESKGLKLCQPFMDAMSSGYIQESWQDIEIQKTVLETGQIEIRYICPEQPEMMSHRANLSIPVGEEFYPLEFTFHPIWIPELPKGWSMLYTNPHNRTDLPFQFLSGIVDSDMFTQSEEKSNMPFYIKKSFTGIIPKGTPLIQMTPIKREDWEATSNTYNKDAQNSIAKSIHQVPWGGYKKHFWAKKTYT